MAQPDLALGSTPDGYRSGFVSIVGRPNVGKSTLLNQILRHKVAITSERPQTTRNAIRGIYTSDEAQLVFVDTPGLHRPRTELGKRLNRVVRDTLDVVDVAIFLLDATGVGAGDEFMASELKRHGVRVLVVLNKLDLVDPPSLERARVKATALSPDEAPFGISAKTGDGVADLVRTLIAAVPEGPLLYPPDALTDQPEAQRIAELIREKALDLTREEVPHSIAVVMDEMDGETIHATIYVERDSQKGIVIGRGGAMLKEIGSRARHDIEAMLRRHVYLDLHVKVAKDWQSRDATLARFGYGQGFR
jgi:GTP-binding protein Era